MIRYGAEVEVHTGACFDVVTQATGRQIRAPDNDTPFSSASGIMEFRVKKEVSLSSVNAVNLDAKMMKSTKSL